MRFVPIKTPEQQAALMMHRSRELLVGQRTAPVNALRGHLAELGIVTAKGIHRIADPLAELVGVENSRIPPLARASLRCLAAQIEAIETRIDELEALIIAWRKGHEASQRLAKIPGVGPITASAVVATIGDGSTFTSARHLSAALGLTPRQNSSGGKARQGGISKAGNTCLRRLLFIGAIAVIRSKRAREAGSWLARLLEHRPSKVVAIAWANKTARVIRAMLRRGEPYRPTGVVAPAAAQEVRETPSDMPRPEGREGKRGVMAKRSMPRPCQTRDTQGVFERASLIGSRAADVIRARGHENRTSRPDT
jgi:transposase